MPVRSATAIQISGTSTPSRSSVTIVWRPRHRRQCGDPADVTPMMDKRGPAPTPIPAEYQIHDPGFFDLDRARARQLRHLHTGSLWAEGPVYLPDGDVLLWSDVRRNRCLRTSSPPARRPCTCSPPTSTTGTRSTMRGTPDRVRARHPLGGAVRARRNAYRARRSLRRQPPQQPQRRRGRLGRLDLVHRSDVRHRQLRGGLSEPSPRSAPRTCTAIDPASGAVTRPGHRHGSAKRSRVVARRALAVRGRHRRQPCPRRAAPHPALRRRCRRRPGDRRR